MTVLTQVTAGEREKATKAPGAGSQGHSRVRMCEGRKISGDEKCQGLTFRFSVLGDLQPKKEFTNCINVHFIH